MRSAGHAIAMGYAQRSVVGDAAINRRPECEGLWQGLGLSHVSVFSHNAV